MFNKKFFSVFFFFLVTLTFISFAVEIDDASNNDANDEDTLWRLIEQRNQKEAVEFIKNSDIELRKSCIVKGLGNINVLTLAIHYQQDLVVDELLKKHYWLIVYPRVNAGPIPYLLRKGDPRVDPLVKNMIYFLAMSSPEELGSTRDFIQLMIHELRMRNFWKDEGKKAIDDKLYKAIQSCERAILQGNFNDNITDIDPEITKLASALSDTKKQRLDLETKRQNLSGDDKVVFSGLMQELDTTCISLQSKLNNRKYEIAVRQKRETEQKVAARKAVENYLNWFKKLLNQPLISPDNRKRKR